MLSKPIAQPKPKPGPAYAAVKRQRVSLDERENQKVKLRSGGRCEVWTGAMNRCTRRAVHVHHLLSGHGTRGRGESAKAARKLHVCVRCHADLHGKVLQRVQGGTPHYADTYRRLT